MRAVILCIDIKTKRNKKYPDIPRMLIPTKGKTSLERYIEGLKMFDVCLVVRQSEAQLFEEYKLPLLVEKNPLGSAGIIKKFIDDLGYRFLVICDNAPHNIDYMEVVTLNQGTVIMTALDTTEEGSPGVVVRGKDAHVVGFSDRCLVDCGIYCMYKKATDYIRDGQYQDICSDLIPRLINNNELYCYEYKNVQNKKGV